MMLEDVIDPHVIIPAFIGGMIFMFAINMVFEAIFVPLPRFSAVWRLAAWLILLVFITYFFPTYFDRWIEGRDIFHTWNPLMVFTAYTLGMGAMYHIIDWRKRSG